jgi:hypothetical protein
MYRGARLSCGLTLLLVPMMLAATTGRVPGVGSCEAAPRSLGGHNEPTVPSPDTPFTDTRPCV